MNAQQYLEKNWSTSGIVPSTMIEFMEDYTKIKLAEASENNIAKKNHIIEKWQQNNANVLDVYGKGSATNEIMQMHRTQMKNILEFIEDMNKFSK